MSFENQFPHLIQAVEGAGLKWQPSRNRDGILFQCPIHNDRNPSAQMWVGDSGNVVMVCFACNTKKHPDVRLKMLSALNLKFSNLFRHQRNWDNQGKLLPSATYEFFDPRGELLYRSCRHNRYVQAEGRVKKFFTLERYEDGQFLAGLGQTPHSLYQLPLWLEQPRKRNLFWVEGEQKAEILSKLGFLSTSLHGGCSQSYQDHFNDWLRGRNITFIPDCGDDSDRMIYNIAGKLMLEGVAESIRITRIPSLQPKQDVWDWIQTRKMSSVPDAQIHDELVKMVTSSLRYTAKA